MQLFFREATARAKEILILILRPKSIPTRFRSWFPQDKEKIGNKTAAITKKVLDDGFAVKRFCGMSSG
jgi:hypothetical protein